MSTETEVDRQRRPDRARAFVADLIPAPENLDRSGPLDTREQRDLDRIHAARDHHQTAKWMRGKSLAAAFSRKLYRGEDGQRTRQEYLNDEWDGISESAAYREINEWPLAAQIAERFERPAPDSHIRALVDVAAAQGPELVARWYVMLRNHGNKGGQRVTAEVVGNLADYLGSSTGPVGLDAMFVPRQLPPAPATPGATTPPADASEPVTGTTHAFPNLGKSERPAPAGDPGQWELSTAHTTQLSTWVTTEAQHADISPDRAADLLMEFLTTHTDVIRGWLHTFARRDQA
ncbi:hypothetical protein ACIBEA_41810 [Streptomyces sp. NPDC051555]|uniref:hypothetical protein n=1 Tax=Streptomyces sp. NPDC051555 TaxID=3365657 RepID=UPI003791041D